MKAKKELKDLKRALYQAASPVSTPPRSPLPSPKPERVPSPKVNRLQSQKGERLLSPRVERLPSPRTERLVSCKHARVASASFNLSKQHQRKLTDFVQSAFESAQGPATFESIDENMYQQDQMKQSLIDSVVQRPAAITTHRNMIPYDNQALFRQLNSPISIQTRPMTTGPCKRRLPSNTLTLQVNSETELDNPRAALKPALRRLQQATTRATLNSPSS